MTPFDVYLGALFVQGPARIQEVRVAARNLFGDLGAHFVETDALDLIHEVVRRSDLVITVRRGVYVISPRGRDLVRTKVDGRALINRRLFLMKSERSRKMRSRGGASAV